MTREGQAQRLQAATQAVRSRLYGIDASGRAPLRVALVVPLEVPAWIARLLAGAAGREWIEVSVVLAELQAPSAPQRIPPDLRAFLAMERLRRRHSSDSMLKRIDVSEAARRYGAPLIAGGADVAQLRTDLQRLAPDVVLLHGESAAAEALADCAPWGCWRIGGELGDERFAGIGLLAPLLDGELATPIALELAFGGSDAQRVELAGGNGATHAGSFGLQREQVLRRLPSLLLRGLRDLHAGAMPMPQRRAADLRLDDGGRRFAFGTGLRAFDISLRNTWQWWGRVWRGEDAWFLAVRSAAHALDPAQPDVDELAVLAAPSGRYWADPCLIERDGRRLLFVEEYGYQESRGVVACLELLDDGHARRLGIALEEAWHLSYPQVFEHDGGWYMTVESGAARRATLYRAAGFPLRWERVGDLLSGRLCVDPTLFHHEGHWYLFANVSEAGAGSTCEELFLFVSESLQGPYAPHPANPIVRDVRRSRPAGRLYHHAGRLIRPAQDCAPDYGAAIVFNEVLELSPTRYRERELARIAPTWMQGLWGCHTYSSVAGTEVIDGRGHPAAGAQCIAVEEGSLLAEGLQTEFPMVTALVPVYNTERYLAEAIESALAQTLPNVEIVVVDDGSTDGSGAIADRYAAAYPDRVRVVHQVNQGLPLARNAAIAVARGRYLALLDADDVWLPGHLAACVDVLERDPTVGLVHADAEDIDADGKPLPVVEQEPRWHRDKTDPYAAVLLRRQHIVCPTAVFRRSVVDNVGPFDPAFNRLGCEDRDLWLRIAEVSNVVYIAGLHARYRIHGANMSANSERMWRARKLLVEKYAQRPRGRPLRRRARAAIDADRGHELAVAPEAAPALSAFARALLRDPLRIDAWKGLLRRILVGRRPAPRPAVRR